MDQLPSEILTKIFSFLDFDTLINVNCNVCKKWLKIVHQNNIKLKTIVVNEEENDSFVIKLFQLGEIINYKNVLVVKSVNYIERRLSLSEIWKNIRKLVIFNCDLDLNRFESIEHLETHRTNNKVIDLKRVPQLIKLNLKRLKILVILLELSVCTNYVLNTPELHSLKTDIEIVNFELLYPKELRHLECSVYDECIKGLKNLKKLICNRFDIYDGKLLSNVVHLEELQVNCIDKGDLTALLSEKETLKLNQLKIIVKGVIVVSKEYPAVLLDNDFEIFSSSNLQLFLENQENLSSDLHFINTFFIDFNITMLPEQIYPKLNNLKDVVVRHLVEDEISWTRLLKASKLIHTVKIYNQICQYFCDIIPLYCPYLGTLSIQKAEVDNFEFLSRFKNLDRFSTDQEITIDEFRMIINMLDQNKFFKFITFKYRRIDFKVERLGDEVYCEYYRCISIYKLNEFKESLKSVNKWPDILLKMKNINEFNANDFKGIAFKLCYKFRNFGADDQPIEKILERLEFNIKNGLM